MKSFLDDRLAIDRLKREYLEHKNLVIGFDFDNTIFDYHNIDLDCSKVLTLLMQCNNLGFTMCLYTVPSNKLGSMTTLDKIEFCNLRNIRVDFVNKSPLLPESIKPFFSILLDDRAGLSASYKILRTALLELNLIL